MSYFKHESSYVDDNVSIGAGTKIWHFSHVQSGSKLGENCILGQNVNIGNNVSIGNNVKIQNNVSIYEGVKLDNDVFCGPSVVFTNVKDPRSAYPQRGAYVSTHIQEGATLGANSTIVCGITIGKFAFVGAGAVVTKDVPEFALILGNPGKHVGWMSRAGVKLDFSKSQTATCPKSNKVYQLRDGKVFEV